MNGLENAPVATTPQALVETTSQREIAEVQASIMLAKKFPRDIKAAIDNIMVACQRPALAEAAIYSYARGGSEITGPSIRLAEAMAQNWGNLTFGIRELEQRNGESTVEAFAWDMETNVRQVKVFQVKHIRSVKDRSNPGQKRTYALEDPRDIYEMTANQGARRLRACILGIIPGDIVEAAVEECESTMKAKADTGPDGVKKLLAAFVALGVSKEQIEKRIQRRIDTITAAQIVGLRKIYNSLKDAMSTVGDWFEAEEAPAPPKTGTEAAKEALKSKVKNKPTQEPKTPPQPPQEEKPATTTRDKAEMILCPQDGEERSVGWCSDSCVTAQDCTLWR
jgi:hypothetical protein